MELKFEKTACRCLRQTACEIQNQEQTQEIRLTDGMPDIGRVLCGWGQVILRSKEWHSDGMNASGGVMVWVLYAPDDGSQPQCVDTWLPFQMKWSFPETQREGSIFLSPLLRSVDARTVSARKLMVKANVGILGQAWEPWEEDICQCGDAPEGIEMLRRAYPIRLPKEAGEKAFVLDEELTLPASCPAAEKILRYDLQPQLLERKVMAGKVVFRGNGLLHVLYRSQSGEIAGWDFEVPFSQFGDLEEDFSQDADARLAAAVTSLELDLTEEGTLRLKCGLVCQYVVTDQMLMEMAEDAYAPNREVIPAFCDLKLPAILEERSETFAAEIPMEIECSRVVDLSFMPDHPHINRMGDQIVGELCGLFQLLYEDNAGNLQSAVRKWEKEWTLRGDSGSRVSMEITAADIPAVALSAGSVSVKGSVCAAARTMDEHGLTMMSGIEIGEEKQPDPARPSLILRRIEGERLWDLAKTCGTTVAAIYQANQLQAEPLEGQLLLIPVQ